MLILKEVVPSTTANHIIPLAQTKLAELCEDRYGQLLLQLDVLEYLYDNNLPIDVRILSSYFSPLSFPLL